MATKLGVSYYCATTVTPSAYLKDMDYLRARGVYILRVWATWNRVPTGWVVNSDGTLNTTNRDKLKALIAAAKAKGMVVDVTLGSGATYFTNFTAHKTGVTNLVTALRGISGIWCIDVANEFPAASYSTTSVSELLKAARAADGSRGGFTASCDGTSDQVISRYKSVIQALGSNWKSYLGMFAPHQSPRTSSMAANTKTYYTAVRNGLKQYSLPIYAQEEGRWNNPYTTAQNYWDSARGAQEGAASNAWVFHTAAGYLLTGTQQIANAFNATEKTALDQVQRKGGLS